VTDPLSARADVSVVVVADGGEPGLPATVRGVLAALADARRGGGRPGGWLRGERLGGELVLVVRDIAVLHPTLRARSGDLLRVVAAPGVGTARARNLGVAAARGRYVLFTDPDARVPRDWALSLTAPLRAGTADLVAGPVRLADDGQPAATVDHAVAATLLDALRDPRQPVQVFSGLNMAVSRAVLEAVGFDDALDAARYPHADASVFHRDVLGAGFREVAVGGAPVERSPDPAALRRRALAARARAHGRGAAYLDRHLHDTRPHPVLGRLDVLGRALALAGLTLRRSGPAALLAAHAALAHRGELVHLRRAAPRTPPRSAAGDVPGGAGAPRAARPVTLVGRDTVARTPLPPAPSDARVRPARRDAPGRGSVYALWGSRRSAAAATRAATPVAEVLHRSTAS
jgi:hypothetical protein